MKMIIWKELRENLKWALLALLALTIAEWWVLYQQREITSAVTYPTLWSEPYLAVTAWGCAAIGATLAALQIVLERRRDQWASLVHRPVSRRTIFFGKVVAGLILYFFATVPPLFISIIYAALPGQFSAPFFPGMIPPAASDLCFGMAFYVFALLLALHRSAWYGRRSILVLGFLPMVALHLGSRWMFLAPLISTILLLAAAAGAMTSNGPIRDYPLVARFSFVLCLFLGAEVIVIIAVVLTGMGCSMLIKSPEQSNNSYRDFAVTRDGRVLVNISHWDDSTTTLTELDGRPVTDENLLQNNRESVFCSFDYLRSSFYFNEENTMGRTRHADRYLQAVANTNGGVDSDAWYLLVDRHQFVGYDKLSRRRIGFLDTAGFHPSPHPVHPFPPDLQSNLWQNPSSLYWSKDQLYRLNFFERNVNPLFAAPNDTINGATHIRTESNAVRYIAVALGKKIQVLDPAGKPLFDFPYGHDPAIWETISIATLPTGDRLFVKYQSQSAQQTRAANGQMYLDEIDLQGRTLHTSTIATDNLVSPETGEKYLRLAGFTLPLVPTALTWTILELKDPGPIDYANDSVAREFLHTFPYSWFAELAVLCAALAAASYFWGRRAGLPPGHCRRWALFVFCFGLPGLITFRIAGGWPAKVRCPDCAHKRSVELEECPGCQHPWPAPKRDGAEIFDLPAREAMQEVG